MANLHESSIYKENERNFAVMGKKGLEIPESDVGTQKRRRNPFSKIPEFWTAKYRCILMGVVLFFSVVEIIMFNVNNFLQGESTRSIMQKLITKYLIHNDTNTIKNE